MINMAESSSVHIAHCRLTCLTQIILIYQVIFACVFLKNHNLCVTLCPDSNFCLNVGYIFKIMWDFFQIFCGFR